MKNFLKRHPHFLRTLPVLCGIFLILISVTPLYTYAQTGGKSISGDEVCGAWDPSANGGKGAIVNPCDINKIGVVTKNLLTYVIGLGLPLLVVFITYRFVMAWFALQQGNANAYKEALKKSFNATIGFLFIVALFGGLMYVMLKYFGVKDGPLQVLKLFSDAFIPHAYAQTTTPPTSACNSPFNMTGICSLYDFILSMLRIIMRFFVYPALIAIWVWTGFGFVMAQGNPEGLSKAKKWLLWAVFTTLLIFMLQMFLIAAQGTVKKILPGFQGVNTTTTTTTPPAQNNTANTSGTLNTRPAPIDGQTNSACKLPDGSTGIVGADGKTCLSGRGAGSTNTSYYCNGKPAGTLCTVTDSSGSVSGTCKSGSDGSMSCVKAVNNDPCITSDGNEGTMDNGTCVAGRLCPDGKNKYYNQSDYRILCNTPAPITTRKKAYGEYCSVNDDCASNNCIFAGWNRVCH
jgi:hypothetical protein